MGNPNRGFVLIDKDMTIRYLWRPDLPNNTVPIDELLDSVREAFVRVSGGPMRISTLGHAAKAACAVT